MTPALTFAVASAALAAGHWTADYWTQTNTQALTKGKPGWAGRRACAAHVATYTLTLAAFLALAAVVLAVPLSWPHVAIALLANAGAHYFADRRTPLRRVAAALGKAEFWDNGGAAPLDQSFHWACLFLAALIIAA